MNYNIRQVKVECLTKQVALKSLESTFNKIIRSSSEYLAGHTDMENSYPVEQLLGAALMSKPIARLSKVKISLRIEARQSLKDYLNKLYLRFSLLESEGLSFIPPTWSGVRGGEFDCFDEHKYKELEKGSLAYLFFNMCDNTVEMEQVLCKELGDEYLGSTLPVFSMQAYNIEYSLLEWRDIFKLLAKTDCHKEVIEAFMPAYFLLKQLMPAAFNDLNPYKFMFSSDPKKAQKSITTPAGSIKYSRKTCLKCGGPCNSQNSNTCEECATTVD